MITKTPSEIRLLEKACRLAAEALVYTGKFVRPGISTQELDDIAHDFILSRSAKSACVGYHGYPKAICTSVNEVICHGVPGVRVLNAGDIINIDITVLDQGFHGDTSATFFVGDVREEVRSLVECARGAMMKGIESVGPGATTGDIGFAIDKFVTRSGFYAVREIGGHGIGKNFHEEPFVPSFGKKGKGAKLLPWGAITVEPMVNVTGAPIVELDIPGSAIKEYKTSDGTWSAQFEHTVLITDRGYEVLTLV